MPNEVIGIHQSDIILREALLTALREVRENPDLIQDALACLYQDALSQDKYGDSTVERCKKWFLATDVPVRFAVGLDNLKVPIILLALEGTSEAEATLGDAHYHPTEPSPLMTNSYRRVESVEVQESYRLQLIVSGEPENLLFLYSIVLFQLLRRKADLLDARGFHRMRWQVGELGPVEIDSRDNFFGRTIQLTGYVRHAWPMFDPNCNAPDGLIESVPFGPQVIAAADVAITPTEPGATGANPFAPADWADRDILSGHK